MPVDSNTQTILEQLRARLEAIYGDRMIQLVLYGSRARGDADPESDIDVLVVLRGQTEPCEEINRTSETVADLSLNSNTVIALFFMDENRFINRNGPLLRNIRREGIAV